MNWGSWARRVNRAPAGGRNRFLSVWGSVAISEPRTRRRRAGVGNTTKSCLKGPLKRPGIARAHAGYMPEGPQALRADLVQRRIGCVTVRRWVGRRRGGRNEGHVVEEQMANCADSDDGSPAKASLAGADASGEGPPLIA